MKTIPKERIIRYRKAYPNDTRDDKTILNLLNEIIKEKRYVDKWINRQVYEGVLTEEELKN